jgi:hypothetical protein
MEIIMENKKYLKSQCYQLVNKILKKNEISKKDLFIALAIRLRLPINECFIDEFDEKMLEKAIKELKYML